MIEASILTNIFVYLVLTILTFVNIIIPISGSAVVTPFLALLADPHRAIALASFYFMLGGMIRVLIFRKEIQFNHVKALLPISLITAAIGALSLLPINPEILLWIIFLFTAYFLYKAIKQHFKSEKISSVNRLTVAAVGLLSGFLQGTGLSGSDLRNNYLYSQKLSLVQVHGTTALIGAANFLTATIIRLLTSQTTVADLTPLIYVLPFMVFATWLGRHTLYRIDRKYADWIIILVMAAITFFLILKILKI